MTIDEAVHIASRLRPDYRLHSFTYSAQDKEWIIQYEHPEDGASGETLREALYQAGWDGVYEDYHPTLHVGKQTYDEFYMIDADKDGHKWTADGREDYPFLSMEMAESYREMWSKDHPDTQFKIVRYMRVEEGNKVN